MTTRTLIVSLAAIAGLAVAGAAFARASSRPSIHVQRAAVAPGGRVHIYGNSGSCPDERLTLISAAFPGHAFGEGTLTAFVHGDHVYSIRGHLRTKLHAGRYTVTARCGGGNLGVEAHVHVS